MSRTRLWLRVSYACTAIALASSQAAGQFVERPIVFEPPPPGAPAGVDRDPMTDLMQSFNFDWSNDAPVARLKLVRYFAEIEGRYVPFYAFTNFAALIPAGQDEATFTSKELVSQFGGLLNLAFAPQFKIGRNAELGKRGLQGDVRIGGKVLNYLNADGDNEYSPIAQVGATLSYFIPFGDRQDRFIQRGLMTLNVRPTGNFFGTSEFRSSFDTDAELPTGTLGVVTDITYHLFEEFVFSAGYSISSSNLVKDQGFAGFTVSRAPRVR